MLNKIMNEHENMIRKYWLLSVFFILVVRPLVVLAIPAISSLSPISEKDLAVCPVGVTIGIIQVVFLWHCAYRNQGTKLLSFYLVSLPLWLVISIMEALTDSGDAGTITASDSSDAVSITTGLISILVELSIFFWWFVLSLKMKDVNKAIKERMLEEKLKTLEEIAEYYPSPRVRRSAQMILEENKWM